MAKYLPKFLKPPTDYTNSGWKWMFEDLFNTVLRIVRSWEPEKRYRREEGYRNDLLKFLRKRLRVKVMEESGRHLCDIGVGEEVGIELKRNLRSISQVDRLWGQLKRFRSSYSNLIVVLVGKTDDSARELLLSHVNDMSSPDATSIGFSQAPRIEVVDIGGRKVKKRRGKEQCSRKYLSVRELLG